MRYFMGGVFVLGVAALLFAADAKKEGPIELTLTGMDGKKVHLSDYAGKPVVVNMWATWCLPCKDEMPLMVEEEKTWGPKGVVFIGASLDDNKTKKNIPEFLKQYQITYPIWTGATSDHLAKLKLGEAVPDTLFLDADHLPFARVLGEIRKEEIEERLAWVTGGKIGPAPEAKVVHLDK
ncbi:MAG TPA: TlpA disulfide reductase family protein [Bryobacteraceae bacterium]|nr:TlpA disulfide reductase family protein [Bryobacteraceae bacterium]